MNELKPCSLDAAQKWVEQEISDYCTDGMLINSEIEAVSALKRIKIEIARRTESENKACPISRLEANEASITLLEIMEDGVAGQQKALSIAYKVLYWIANSRRIEPENKALTLEELEQRDGKPVGE
jgi:hypothetical protein